MDGHKAPSMGKFLWWSMKGDTNNNVHTQLNQLNRYLLIFSRERENRVTELNWQCSYGLWHCYDQVEYDPNFCFLLCLSNNFPLVSVKVLTEPINLNVHQRFKLS